MKRLFLILSGVMVLSGATLAQRVAMPSDSIVFRADVEREFVEGMRFFLARQYDSAATVFVNCIREYPRSHRATGAYIMGAKALYETGRYRDAVRLLKDLMDIYPYSQYVDDAHYTLGLVYFRLRRYEDAASELLTARQTADDPKLMTRAERLLGDIAAEHLSIAELQVLAGAAQNDVMKALLNLRLAEQIYRTGDARAAEEVARPITTMSPAIPYVGQALDLLQRIRSGGVVRVGVVLPLMLKSEMPVYRAVGLDFANGIQLAVDEYNATAETKVNLDIRDTERDPAKAAQVVAELCRDDKVTAILGPVLSNEVFASAGIANERGVPLITPTATSNGIAAIGPYIFQANPDFTMRGKAAAAYAVTDLNAKRVAVVSPSDAVGTAVSNAFIAEATRRGATIVDVEWYPAGSTDIRSELMSLREKALAEADTTLIDFGGKMKQADITRILAAGADRHVVDSLMERGVPIDVRQLFGDNGRVIADSLGFPTRTIIVKRDSLELPVNTIDVIFCPIASSDEIAVVSTQMRWTNFHALVLGTGDWNDLNSLDENRSYTDGVTFVTDAYYDPNSQPFREFKLRYERAFKGRPPTLNTLYGYDACAMLLQTIGHGAVNRNQLASALAAVRGYTGLHTKISFGPGRVNSCLTVLQYRARQIWRVGEVDLTAPEETQQPTTP